MADSDNITTLPLVTRRGVVMGTAIAIASAGQNAFGRDGADEGQSSDLSLLVWEKWQVACQETERLCREQQSLELRLMEAVGFPDGASPLHQARWDAADNELGYSTALRAECIAAGRADELLALLSNTPSTSLAGVAAKLDAVLRQGQSCDDESEFPWPHIRSAWKDLIQICQQHERR